MFSESAKIITTLLILVACIGCSNQTDVKTDTPKATGPQSFSEAAEQLVVMKNKIRDGFATGDLDSAHGPLHEVGHLLENLSTLAQQADLPAEQLEAVKQANETLFGAFDNIDKTFHGGEGSTYDEEAEAIQAAMKVIVEAAGVTDDSASDSNPPSANDGLPPVEADPVDSGTVSGDTDADDQ